MQHPASFGTCLRQRRKALDLTQAEVAKCAGCSVSALRKIEMDERRVRSRCSGRNDQSLLSTHSPLLALGQKERGPMQRHSLHRRKLVNAQSV